MNIAQVIVDASRGRAPRPRGLQRGALDPSPAAEFLLKEVWPLLKQARTAVEERDLLAVALQPPGEDDAQCYTLLIMDSSCKAAEDACFLRFLIQDQRIHLKVQHSGRNDEEPVPLDPPGSILLLQDIIEDFVYHCVTPREMRKPLFPDREPAAEGIRSLQEMAHLTAAH